MSRRFVWLSEVPERAAQLAEWHVAEWAPLIPGFNVPDMLAEFSTHDGCEKIPTTLVALDGEDLLGSVSLLENDHDDIRDYSPWLASLYVRPQSRGRGLGVELVRRCENIAQRLGITRLHLYTSGQERFYRRLGWEDVASVSLRGVQASVLGIAPRALGH
ncbi:MAG: GNAT family N-acetyltransferase [Xanthomonadales bacterium]|nr:GNAT family N-acetyltransferase [Xanthomonadales bacterium]MBK7144183.1 GNAT family N-acetyltransferase [Xanthomonadales bacterium]MCC6560046.1 GNAT family N-acetyltransferase [Xanthomonadales bacterium]